jgi:hypothetical protein
MEPECALPYSQERTTGCYPEPVQSIQYHPSSYSKNLLLTLPLPADSVPPLSYLKSFTPTKNNVHFAVSLAAVVSEPVLYRLPILHTRRIKLILIVFRVQDEGANIPGNH